MADQSPSTPEDQRKGTLEYLEMYRRVEKQPVRGVQALEDLMSGNLDIGGGVNLNGESIGIATQDKAGLLSATDKRKIDRLQTYAAATSMSDGLMSSTDKARLDTLHQASLNPQNNSGGGGSALTNEEKAKLQSLPSGGYRPATTDADGLLSRSDKAKLDRLRTYDVATQYADGLISKDDKKAIDQLKTTVSNMDSAISGAQSDATNASTTAASAKRTADSAKDAADAADSKASTNSTAITRLQQDYTALKQRVDAGSGGAPVEALTDEQKAKLAAIPANGYAVATTAANGLMSRADKAKLDELASKPDPVIPTYSNATTAKDGLMSKEDKAELNRLASMPEPVTALATSNRNGLMSSEDKAKLDNVAARPEPIVSKATNGADGLMSKEDKAKLDEVAARPAPITSKASATADGLMSKEDKAKVAALPDTFVSSVNGQTGAVTIDAVTKGEVNTLIAQEVLKQAGGGKEVDLSGYVTKTDMNALTSRPALAATVEQLDTLSQTGTKVVSERDVVAYVTSQTGETTRALTALVNDKAAANHTHADATTTAAGMMSAQDKTRLDELYARPAAKEYAVATNDTDGLMSAQDRQRLYRLTNYGLVSDEVNGLMSIADKKRLDELYNRPVTSYAKATQLADGLMSKEDKLALDTIANRPEQVTYTKATTTADGLMSKEDKAKLDGLQNTVYDAATNDKDGLMSAADKATLSRLAAQPSPVTTNATATDAGLMSPADKNALDTLRNRPVVEIPGAATKDAAGLMSAADKAALDKLVTDSGNVITTPKASATVDGLMSKEDKVKLDGLTGAQDVDYSKGINMRGGIITGIGDPVSDSDAVAKAYLDTRITAVENIISTTMTNLEGPEAFGIHVNYYGPSFLGAPLNAGNGGGVETNAELSKRTNNSKGVVTFKENHTIQVNQSGVYHIEMTLVGGDYTTWPLWINQLVAKMEWYDGPNNSEAHAVYGGKIEFYCTLNANKDYRMCLTSSNADTAAANARRKANGVKVTVRRIS